MVPVPIGWPCSRNVTMPPDGMPKLAVTVAVSVTGWVNTAPSGALDVRSVWVRSGNSVKSAVPDSPAARTIFDTSRGAKLDAHMFDYCPARIERGGRAQVHVHPPAPL